MDELRMIENVTGKRLPACPSKSPEGWSEADFAQLFFRLVPDGHGLMRQMQCQFRQGIFLFPLQAIDRAPKLQRNHFALQKHLQKH